MTEIECCVACLTKCDPKLAENTKILEIFLSLLSLKLPLIFDSRALPKFCRKCCKKLEGFSNYKEKCLKSISTIEKLAWKSGHQEIVEIIKIEEELNGNHEDEPPRKKIQSKPETSIPIYCHFCESHFTNYAEHVLGEHSNAISGNIFQCNICDTKTNGKYSMRTHHHNQHRQFENAEQCPQCFKSFWLFGELKRHKLRHKEAVEQYECHFCGITYGKKQRILYHLFASHSKSKCCKYCMKIFECQETYRGHMKEEVGKRTKETHVCDICGFGTHHKRYLLDHIARRHNHNEVSCSQCGKVCKSRQNLKDHLLNRHREKLIECTLCVNKTFRNKAFLREHMKLVHPSKTIPCTVCGKNLNPNLVKRHHFIVHSTIRPHECRTCGHSFKVKAGLLKHLHSHSGTRPFNCQQCNQGYYTRELLQKHYSQAHGITYTTLELRELAKRMPSALELEL